MASGQLQAVLRQLRKLEAKNSARKLSDRELLLRYVTRRDEGAFEALLARHGRMVLEVCRRVLPDASAAEDAFQATFLVLVRKAASIRKAELLGNWLYGVAYRTASRLKVEAAKRRARESAAPAREPADPLAEMTVRELFSVLDEELNRLPSRYRAPLVSCYLESRRRDEAARQLGYSLATLERRLERGRELLRARLVRRGLTLSATLLATALTGEAHGVPASLALSTVSAAKAIAAGGAAASIVSAKVVALSEGVVKTMFATKLKIVTAVLLAIAAAGIGFSAATQNPPEAKPKRAEPQNDKPLAKSAEAEPKGPAWKAAMDALARFENGWNPPASSLRPSSDTGWKAKMEALVALAKAGPAAEPVLDDAWGKGSQWSEWTRDFAFRAKEVIRGESAARKALLKYDPAQIDTARLGKLAPDFSLTDISGRTYRLSDFRGKQPVLLVFIVEGFG
jgi:RNA polymerase sigma factor (sigma-70 family)